MKWYMARCLTLEVEADSPEEAMMRAQLADVDEWEISDIEIDDHEDDEDDDIDYDDEDEED